MSVLVVGALSVLYGFVSADVDPRQALRCEAVPSLGVHDHHEDVLTREAAQHGAGPVGKVIEVLPSDVTDRATGGAGRHRRRQIVCEHLAQQAGARVAVEPEAGLVHPLTLLWGRTARS